MNKIQATQKIFLIFILMVMPIKTFSSNLSDVYVQSGGKLIGLSDAVSKANGSITFIGSPSKYLIDVNGRKAVVDFSSEKSIRAEMSAFYPDHIVVQITFLGVRPNTMAFLDNTPIATIDKNGNSITPIFPVSEPGKHIIQLKHIVKTFDSITLNISSSSSIECSGIDKMKCNIFNT